MKKPVILGIVALFVLATVGSAVYFYTWYSSQERQLPEKDLAKLEGKAGFAWPSDRPRLSMATQNRSNPFTEARMQLKGAPPFEGTLYNGSQWEVTRLVVELSAEGEDGSTKWTRDYAAEVSISPMTEGSFSIPISDSEGVVKARWTIKDAFGYKQ